MGIEKIGNENVLVTGSNGAIGQAVVSELSGAGYRVTGFDLEPDRTSETVDHWTGDLLDPDSVDAAVGESDVDAVVHLGTIPNPLGRPGHETYRSNAITTYNLLEAAHVHDVSHVSIASSINAMGAVFQEAPMEVEYLPVDEDHPVTPRDPYALGKRTIELQAEGFGRKRCAPASLATFRFPWVASRDEIRDHLVEADRTLEGLEADPFATRDDLFAYLALEDAARALRMGIEASFTGHENFFVAAADTNVETPTEDVVEACYEDATLTEDLSGSDGLVNCEKAKRMLGWEPTVSWQALPTREREGVAAEWRAARRQSRSRTGLTKLVQ